MTGNVDIKNLTKGSKFYFDFDIMPNANGPIESVTPGFDLAKVL